MGFFVSNVLRLDLLGASSTAAAVESVLKEEFGTRCCRKECSPRDRATEGGVGAECRPDGSLLVKLERKRFPPAILVIAGLQVDVIMMVE
jgi:hypothetical protein